MKKIQAKPFSTDFDEQLDAAEALYGVQVQFDFSMKDGDLRKDPTADATAVSQI